MLKKEIFSLFEKEHIRTLALLPFSACRVTNPKLYEKKDFIPQSVIVYLVPYFWEKPENFSAYAAAEDYHFYAAALYERLCEGLKSCYPDGDFLGFADHSPIDERDAAIRAGLGVFGKNRLLLSKEYGSYQFIGEILCTLPPEALGTVALSPFTTCIGCDACLAACPTGILRGESHDCLSAITQKKGVLSEEEKALMRRTRTVWGCDVCQEICPINRAAKERGSIYTEIPFFKTNIIRKLDTEALEKMDKESFSRRAFAWRGKETVLRNTRILEEK